MPNPSRLAYIDWMRGFACLWMFQTHCYDSWLGGDARKSTFFTWSQLGGTLPAPLFLFLAGVSVALVVGRSRQKGVPTRQIALTVIRRGAEILGLGLLFRLQEFVIALGWAPRSDLLRVDILNTIGVSIALLGVLFWLCFSVLPMSWRGDSRSALALALTSTGAAAAISLLAPLLWTSWRPRWLPWPLESYINGVHNFNQPQSYLFPIFPWAGFAFAGLAAGSLLFSARARKREALSFAVAGGLGLGCIVFSRWIASRPWQLYPVFDYWHTSPEFFVLRVGVLLILLGAAYAWCRWGAGQWGFSPMVQLGQTSLLVYWVHIEFVYGRFSILPKRAQSIPTASLGLLTIFLAMLLLSWLRTELKGRGADLMAWFRGAAKPEEVR